MAIFTNLTYEEAQALPNPKYIQLNKNIIPVIAYTGDDIISTGEVNGNGQYYSIAGLIGYVGNETGQVIYVSSYYDNSDNPSENAGGGYFTWDENEPRANHNGITKISPTVPWNGLQSGLSAFLAGTGETTPSGLGCWIRQYDRLSPTMAGADITGVVSSLVAFQAIINVTTDGTAQVFRVPTGTYLGDMSTLTYGTRNVVWEEDGEVSYTTAKPSVNSCLRMLAHRSDDTVRPYIEGNIGFHSGAGESTENDFALVRMERKADYNATASGVSYNLWVNTNVSSTVGTAGTTKPEWAIIGRIINNSPYCNAVAVTGQATRAASTDANVWSGQFNTIDNNSNTTGLTKRARAIEANVQADGLDTTNTRSIIDAISHNIAQSYAGGVDAIGYGFRAISSSADMNTGFATQSNGSSKIFVGMQNGATGTTGYKDTGTWSADGVSLEGSYNIGIDLIDGTFSTAAFRLGTDNKIMLTDANTAWVGYVTATSGIELSTNSILKMAIGSGVYIGAPTGTFKGNGTLNVESLIYVNGTQVLGARKTGWSADTGTAKRTANATYSGTAEGVYTQATIQALMDALRDATQEIKALKDDLISHGIIGA